MKSKKIIDELTEDQENEIECVLNLMKLYKDIFAKLLDDHDKMHEFRNDLDEYIDDIDDAYNLELYIKFKKIEKDFLKDKQDMIRLLLKYS